MNINDLDISKCVGCFSCEYVCPKKAISFKKKEFGFIYPIIDRTKCINCGLCVERCTISKIDKNNVKSSCFSYISPNKDELKCSSSGGAFFNIAKSFIKDDCIVYGCVMDESRRVVHERADRIEDLHKFQGSKYVQSDIRNVYKLIKNDLDNKEKILFCGTPCQVNAIKLVFAKHLDNLYLIDLVCHGVPSNEFFRKYIENIEKVNNSRIGKIFFRKKYSEKSHEKTNFYESFKISNNKTVVLPYYKSLYYHSFLKEISYRESCYSCSFADLQRVGDITLGDFWGLYETSNNKKNTLGCSLILVNSKKGEVMINELKGIAKEDISIAVSNNKQLTTPATKTKYHSELLKLYENNDFCDIVKWWKKRFRKDRFISFMKYHCPLFVKRLIKKAHRS